MDTGKAADTVHLVHDIVARGEVGVGIYALAISGRFLFAPRAVLTHADKLRIGDNGKLYPGVLNACAHRADTDIALAALGHFGKL